MGLDSVLKWEKKVMIVTQELIPRYLSFRNHLGAWLHQQMYSLKFKETIFSLGIQKYPKGEEQRGCLQSRQCHRGS